MANNSIPIDPEKLELTKEEVNKVLALHGSSIPSWAEFDEHHPSKQLCKAQVQAVLSSPILAEYIDQQKKEAYGKGVSSIGDYPDQINQARKEAREQGMREVITWILLPENIVKVDGVCTPTYWMNAESLQTQLKEWGIALKGKE